jgi:UDP-GlcNAc:undecaprenyl-phosphate GlcNAc-1-phosphate transferase
MLSQYLYTFVTAIIIAIIICPFLIKYSHKIGAVDAPNYRKMHTRSLPTIGGVAIYFAFLVAFLYIAQITNISYTILVGATIIFITGFVDDLISLKPWQKLLGQIIATVIVLGEGIQIHYLTLPFVGESIHVNYWVSFAISFVWIIGITNGINLIDGLDGLAAGVSGIAATSIFAMALIMGNIPVALLSLALVGSTAGFLCFNTYPAKIFMGDTGALFLGFMLAVLSVMGYKQVTLITVVIPIIILAVPIIDTLVAIVRRKVNRQKITVADKSHIHHKLIDAGFSHRGAVFFIYGISFVFGSAAVIFSQVSLLGASIIFIALILVLELLIEHFNLINNYYKPIIKLYQKLRFFVYLNQKR